MESKLLNCEECGREFATQTALAQHLKDKHGVVAPRGKSKGYGDTSRTARKTKSLRKRNRHPVAIALVAVALVAGVGIYFVTSPYLGAGPPFPTITGEGWIHVHPYLVISIEGRNITIPVNAGAVEGGTALEPVHTHDSSGILHVELSRSDSTSHNYTLGDFFAIWNYSAKNAGMSVSPVLNGKVLPVVFSSSEILGFHANSTYQVLLFVDGHNCVTSSYALCPVSPAQWGNLNIEHLDYCSSSTVAPGRPPLNTPCYPSDSADLSTGATCTATTTQCAITNPYWGGTNNYPYGTGHTIVIKYVKG